MTDLREKLAELGADPASLRMLDTDGPDLLPYATLLNARRSGDQNLDIVTAVYEWQGAPLLFLVDFDQVNDLAQLHRIRRLLAMRGDAPYLGVVAPGRLEVYRIALDRKTLAQSQLRLASDEGDLKGTFAHLANIRPQASISQHGWISNVVLNLLTASITSLIDLGKISDDDAISLVGRALFTRFLADRNLLPTELTRSSAAAADLFDTRTAAQETSAWLDQTFNGDLLPLAEGIFNRLPRKAYQVLGDVMRRAPDGKLFLGWEQKWDNLDFAHIPVGVLSQAYELYLRNHAPAKQRREGGYYTPRAIADLLVRACFKGLERRGSSADAKILDPAVGAGVFLLTAFRELVAERWKADGSRPRTATLRSILYKQLVGFDINEAALRFAALGLYLLSIELDPQPKPINKLRFDNLRGKVLHRITSCDPKPGAELGSLGPMVDDYHRGRYDIIVGNPPWASGTKLHDWQLVCDTVARIATARDISNHSPPIPNEVLDLPFLWRAMEWAKPGGQIAFALHARLLFQHGDGMREARQAIFEALDVTSVVNGVDLRQTKVWPEISAPFCLLIATNRKPTPGSGFRLISPRLEESLNAAGSMRIDAHNSEIILTHQMAETPEILKILFRGTKADLGVLERIRAKGHPTLQSFWRDALGTSSRGRLRGAGNGYQTLKPSSRVRKGADGLPGADASYLRGLPDVTVASLDDVLLRAQDLKPFRHRRIHDPRDPELFVGPLTVVHQSPSVLHERIKVAVCDQGVAYNESFYGFSAAQLTEGKVFSRYLALVLGSRFALWFALLTSGKFGFEREVVEKASLDRIPLPDFRALSSSQRKEISSLFKALQKGEIGWTEVDLWVARLYGLGKKDLQIIDDTLAFNLPFASNKREAQSAPNRLEVKRFCKRLEQELVPWVERFGSMVAVSSVEELLGSPWVGIAVFFGTNSRNPIISAKDWLGLVSAADAAAAAELVLVQDEGTLLIGRLAQRRYWSDTQAKLLAQRIVWSHLKMLKGRAIA
jgi:type I restriction-modification system DNA methylase subunit